MARIETRKVEEQPEHRLLFTVRLNSDERALEFPIGVTDRGSESANERAVLGAALSLAEDLTTAVRQQVDGSAGA